MGGKASSYFISSVYGAGWLEIKITDPPKWGQATLVYLNYSAIELHRADAGNESDVFTVVDESAWINLPQAGDVNQTIGDTSLQAGLYNLIRLQILDAIVTVGATTIPPPCPVNDARIAITKGDIRIVAGQTATILIDLETKVEGTYRIVPAVRAVPQ